MRISGLGVAQLVGGEHEAVLHAVILLLVEETLLLHACHVEHVELVDDLLKRLHLAVGNAQLVAHLMLHVARQTELFRSDEHDIDALELRESLDERVDSAAELQVTAEADGEVVETTYLALDCQQVGQCLSRVGVGAVTGVYDRGA